MLQCKASPLNDLVSSNGVYQKRNCNESHHWHNNQEKEKKRCENSIRIVYDVLEKIRSML